MRGYDYTQPGAYFVTICTHERLCLFGRVVNGKMRLNALGEIVKRCWRAIPGHFPHARLDTFVVMPNHVHGIIWIVERADPPTDHVPAMNITPATVGATHASPLRRPPRGPKRHSIAAIVGSFKSAAAKRINEMRATPGARVWQRNYYEHIIRTERALNAIRQYIIDNPMRWHVDRHNAGVRAPTRTPLG